MEDTSGGETSVKYTLKFTAPEVLLPSKQEKTQGISYYPVDIWAVACISVFMLTKNSPFPDLYDLANFLKDGNSLEHHTWKISDTGRKFLLSMLTKDPAVRPSAREALESEWLAKENIKYP
jgi:serine/threonine protein kinase